MSEPEIARRCNVCGASVRGAAHFCPQCGQTMDGAEIVAAPARARAQPALVDEAERAAASISGRLTARGDDVPAPDAINTSTPPLSVPAFEPDESRKADEPLDLPPVDDGERAGDATTMEDRAGVVSESPQVAGVVEPPAAGRLRQRAASVGTAASETLRPRVGKLRERSVVVLDEAADDPGLRFVLVAAALFVVALLLFIFNFALR